LPGGAARRDNSGFVVQGNTEASGGTDEKS
jgi:hypothetical protein